MRDNGRPAPKSVSALRPRHRLAAAAEPETPGDRVILVTPPASESQFSLKTLLIVVTGLCIWLAIMVAYPIAGVILAIVALFLVAVIGCVPAAPEGLPMLLPPRLELPAELFIRTFGLPALATHYRGRNNHGAIVAGGYMPSRQAGSWEVDLTAR